MNSDSKKLTGIEIGIKNIAATGVGFGGPVYWETGIIQTSHQVEVWSGFNLKARLQTLTNALVGIQNDANVAALAEAIHGNGSGHNPVFFITIGIGGGFIVDKEIYHGVNHQVACYYSSSCCYTGLHPVSRRSFVKFKKAHAPIHEKHTLHIYD